jgi:hypothetical protein
MAFAAGTLLACNAAAVGKPEVTAVCNTKMGSSAKCACFADALEKALTPEEFTAVAQGVEANKSYAGLLPGNLSDDPKIGAVVADASQTCFN